MKVGPRQLYGVAAGLAIVSAILQLTAREWFRGATGVIIAVTLVLAATGFPERSVANRRVYFALLGVIMALLIIQIYSRLSGP